LNADTFGIALYIPAQDFDVIATNYPGSHPGIILISTESDGIQWFVQIMPE
jgi:hypothetical protein